MKGDVKMGNTLKGWGKFGDTAEYLFSLGNPESQVLKGWRV